MRLEHFQKEKEKKGKEKKVEEMLKMMMMK
jgi:hypothetical protein